MRYALVTVLALHGLIHLMGTAKAFGLAELPQLTQPISRPMGVMWLTAALLVVGAAGMLATGARSWWAPGLLGAVVSQLVIVSSWSDARFGTLGNVILVVTATVAALGHAPWSYRTRYEREGTARATAVTVGPVVTDADLATLPAPVTRWLRQLDVVGRPRPTSLHARFSGAIRSGPTAPWMPFVAEQRSFFERPARLFFMEASRGGIPFDVLHLYLEGQATMQVRVASLVTMVDASGPTLSRSETVTHLNDVCLLAPGALLGPGFRWEALEGDRARVHFSAGGHEVAAELVFDAEGRLADFVSDDRTRSDDGVHGEALRWSTPIRRWSGPRITEAEAIWHARDGAYAYGRFRIESLTLDALTPRAG